jgi:peptide/nickel transport system permease protein
MIATVRRDLRRVAALPPALIGAIVILVPFAFLALFPSLVAPYSQDYSLGPLTRPPSGQYLLGTDQFGHDSLTYIIYGARYEFVISISATLIAFVVGSLIGIAIGYRGGFTDVAGMRVVDVFLAFPAIIFAIFLLTIFGHSELVEIIAIAAVMAPSMARYARGLGVVLRNRAYVDVARIMRAPSTYIVRRHLFPNALRSLLVAASVLGAFTVIFAASLDYLGLGNPLAISWGNMLHQAFDYVFSDPWYGIPPGICIVLLAYGYLLLGQGLGQLQGRTGSHEREFRTSVLR